MSEPTYQGISAELFTKAVDAIEAVGVTVSKLADENGRQWDDLAAVRDELHTLANRIEALKRLVMDHGKALGVLSLADPHEVQR